MILRGKDIDHHRIEDDMMHKERVQYRPQIVPDISAKDSDVVKHLDILLLFQVYKGLNPNDTVFSKLL